MSVNDANFPETLLEAVEYFADRELAFEFMVALRWPDGVVRCPCGSEWVGFLSTRRVWKCRECRRQFSVKVGTVFEDSPLGLDKWLPAVWVIVNAKNGVSSCELARSLGVTQKTAWFMLHRIRLAIQAGSMVHSKLTGTVEVDESWIGGKARYMHQKVKKARGINRGNVHGKTPVMAVLQRGTKRKSSKVVAEVIIAADKDTLDRKVRHYVLKGSEVHTDEHKAYADLSDEYTHKVVNHAEAYVQDGVHTNGLENFWSLLKRTIKGTYVSVEPFHLFRYLSEQVFRFNERKDKEGDRGRFLTACFGLIGKRLTYRELIGAEAAGLEA